MKTKLAILILLATLMVNCGGILYEPTPTYDALVNEYDALINGYQGSVKSVVEKAGNSEAILNRCLEPHAGKMKELTEINGEMVLNLRYFQKYADDEPVKRFHYAAQQFKEKGTALIHAVESCVVAARAGQLEAAQ